MQTDEEMMKRFVSWMMMLAVLVLAVCPVPPPAMALGAEEEPRDADMVRMTDYLPMAVDMVCAGNENFAGFPLYDYTDAWLRYGTVKKLMAASDALAAQGLGLILWDAFRSDAVQQQMEDTWPDRDFADHTRGHALDVTLCDGKTGEPVPMPSAHGDMTDRGDRDWGDCAPAVAENVRILESVMAESGFSAGDRWWHYADSKSYPAEKFFDPAGIVDWVAECDTFTAFRDAPEGNFLAWIPDGAELELRRWDGKYARVRWRGRYGYVKGSDIRPADAAYPAALLDTVEPTAVYSYEQMLKDVTALEERYPDSVSVISLGESELGRDIPVMRIGDLQARHHILLHAGIHAREHMTSWLVMAMADHWLAAGIAAADGVCFHIVPMVNPDGVTLAQTGVLTDDQLRIYESDRERGLAGGDMREYAARWKANGVGVDLNRNFPSGWLGPFDRKAPSCMQYPGPAPFSAAETAALRDYTLRFGLDVTVSYHASGSAVYCQYGKKQPVNELSHSLGEYVHAVSGYRLMGRQKGDGAGYKDWAMDERGIPSLTVEIGSEAAPLEENEIYSVFARNIRVMPTLLRWLRMQDAAAGK